MSPKRVVSRLVRDIRSVLSADSAQPEQPSARSASHVRCRERITVQGRVVAIGVRPRSDGVSTLTADVDCDPTVSSIGQPRVRLIWQGRSSIAGLRPGDVIRASGVETHIVDHVAIVNPEYDLVPRDAVKRTQPETSKEPS